MNSDYFFNKDDIPTLDEMKKMFADGIIQELRDKDLSYKDVAEKLGVDPEDLADNILDYKTADGAQLLNYWENVKKTNKNKIKK